jgi:nicotinate-nucleotide adenylyltransferase
MATLVAVNRGDTSLEELSAGLDASIRSRIQLVTMPGVQIAATDVRSRAAEDRSLRFLVPRAVEQYIRQHELYSTQQTADD